MADKTLRDVIDRLAREGDLIRNSGSHSIKSVKDMLKDESGKDNARFEDLRDAIVTQSSRVVKAQLRSAIPPSEKEEERREREAFQQKQIEALNKVAARLNVKPAAQKVINQKQTFTGKNEGILSSVGGLFKGVLGGAGLLAGGLGVLAGGGAFLIDKIIELDVDKLENNVTGLLSIGDQFEGGNWEFLAKGGAFGVAMTGLAVGLSVFAVGSAAAAAVDYFAREGWAERVRDNVLTLLSIADAKNQVASLQGFALGGAFMALGAGLAVFSAGAAIQNAVQLFEKEGWAQKVVDNVRTLLQIAEINASFGPLQGIALGTTLGYIGAGLIAFSAGEGIQRAVGLFGDPGWAQTVVDNTRTLLSLNTGLDALVNLGSALLFVPVMTALGAGLAAFSLGQGVRGAVDLFSQENWAQTVVDNVNTLLSLNKGLDALVNLGAAVMFAPMMSAIGAGLAAFAFGQGAAAISEFFSKEDWAQTIVDNVKKLTEVSQNDFGDVAGTSASLTLLGSGLAVFGVGQTAVAIGETLSSDDWTQRLVNNVRSLLDVVKIPGIADDSVAFVDAMARLGVGLTAFGAGQFVQTLGSAGQAILGFFGVDSPFDQMKVIADNADNLEKGSIALDRIGSALGRFSNIKVADVDVDFEKLATDLATTIPLMEKLAFGGIYDPGFFSRDIDFGTGILDPALRLDEVYDKVNKVNEILGRTSAVEAPAVMAPELPSREIQTTQMRQADRESRELSTQNVGVAVDNSAVDNSTVVNNNSTTAAIVNQNMPTVDALDRTYQ